MSAADKPDKTDPFASLADAFGDMNMGPAWARDKKSGGADAKKKFKKAAEREERRGGGRDRRGRDGGGRGRDGGNRGRGGYEKRERRPRREPVVAPAHIAAEIMPTEPAVDVLAGQVTGSGRTWSVFDQARIILEERERFSVIFQSSDKEQPLYFCKDDRSVWLTRAEAIAHVRGAEWLSNYYAIEEIEVDKPTGNFSAVAKCGLSGEWLGPPNFHGYQEKLRELHRERFAHMDLERYRAKVETVKGEEAVAEWLESMGTAKVYRVLDPKDAATAEKAEAPSAEAPAEADPAEAAEQAQSAESQPEGEVLKSYAEVEAHFVANHFDKAYETRLKAWVPSGIEAKLLSPGLLIVLRDVIADERRYPSKLAAFLCRQFTGRRLAAFKFQGKLKCGPARPKAVPADANFAERPTKMLEWLTSNDGAELQKMWDALVPAEATDEDKKAWDVDLQWLLREGYVILLPSLELFIAKKVATAEPAKKTEPAKSEPVEAESPQVSEEKNDAPDSQEG